MAGSIDSIIGGTTLIVRGRSVPLSLALFFGVMSAVCFSCSAQVVDPITAVEAPVPGVGHNYIGTGTETVNPADGSVTFDLPLNTPPGRQISFPFAIHYRSLNPFYIANNGDSYYFYWQTATGYGNAPPFILNGWSYQLPNYVAQGFVASAHPVANGGEEETNYCWAGQDYRFEGFDHSHTLYASYQWPDPNNPVPQSNSEDCPQPSMSGLGDDGVEWSFGTVTGNYNSGEQPPLTVTDRMGTVYQFPQGPAIENNPTVSTMSAPFGALAETITDRNGNQITLNGNSTVNAGGGLPAGNYSDTLGRPIVSWTGIGNSAGDQLTISGLGTVVVKWTTTTATFPDGTNDATFVSGSASPIAADSSNCTFAAHKSIPMSVVSEIDLPNGQKYSFTYGGAWGRLTQITFPNGGYVQYTWGTNSQSQEAISSFTLANTYPESSGTAYCWSIIDTPAITDRYVSYNGSTVALHQHFKYSTSWNTSPNSALLWTSKQTTVTSYDLISGVTKTTQYTYAPIAVPGGPYDSSWQSPSSGIPVEKAIVYEDGNGNVLRTVNKTWMNQFSMVGDQTILDNGQGTTTLRCYDYYDRVLGIYKYNFQSAGSKPADPTCAYYAAGTATLSGGLNTSAIGPLLLQTAVSYHSFPNTNILDEPDSITISDSSGNKVKQTTYQYDQTAVMPSGAGTGLVGPPGQRGNATSVTTWLNSGGSSPTTTYTYYDTGQVQSMTEPCGNPTCSDMISPASTYTTSYSYKDNFALGAGTAPGATNAYLTQVTYPNTGTPHQESFSWGYSDGLLMSRTDENSQTTNYTYNDPLNRLTEVQGPPDPSNGNQRPTTTYSYIDSTPNPSVTTTTVSSPSPSVTKVSVMDGMGHVVQTELASDPQHDYVDTIYDGEGRVYQQSNPTRCSSSPGSMPSSCSESTWGVTTFNYDALGRKVSQLQPDKATQYWCYDGVSDAGQPNCVGHIGSTNGSWVDFTDEDGNHWQRTTDALGRLTEVIEDASGSKLETDYQYDALNDLTRVDQWGGVSGGSGDHVRTFTYDSLGRLLSSSNPEVGTIGYSYDADGNVITKTSPSPNSPSGTITTSYTYDALNRVLSKRSNDGAATPAVCYQYDASSQASANGNLIGRLANEWTQSATANNSTCAATMPTSGTTLLTSKSILSYDPMGRIVTQQSCVYPTCTTAPAQYPMSYNYDLSGNITTYTNGNNSILLTNSYDAAGRLSQITSSLTGPKYQSPIFSYPTYNPGGGLLGATYGTGTGITQCRSYDQRLRITGEIDTSGAVPSSSSCPAEQP